LLFKTFLPIVDKCLSCEDTAYKVVRWCPDGKYLAMFLRPVFHRAACSTFHTYILTSHEGHVMCGSMVQSATAEIRRGKKEIEEEEETTG